MSASIEGMPEGYSAVMRASLAQVKEMAQRLERAQVPTRIAATEQCKPNS